MPDDPDNNNKSSESDLREDVDSAEITDEQKDKELDDKEPNPDEIEPETRGSIDDDEGDQIDPDDEKTISKVVKQQLAGVTTQFAEIQKLKDDAEVTEFIRVNPEYGKYRNIILKYLAHADYKNIPVYNIAAIVAAKDLQKFGAEKERKAALKAKQTQGGGSTARKAEETIDWYTASREAFEAQRAKILGQQG